MSKRTKRPSRKPDFQLDEPVPDNRRSDLFVVANTLFAQALYTAKQRRDAVGTYYEEAIGQHARVALIDIGWHGNMQRWILQCCRNRIDPNVIHGYLVATLAGVGPNLERGLNIKGWMANAGNPWHVQHFLTNGGVELLEFALTANHGSTIALTRLASGEIVPVLEAEPHEAAYRNLAMRVQVGIRSFVRDHAYLLDIYRPETLCTKVWAQPFERLATRPTRAEARLLCRLSHSDVAGTNASRLLLAERQHWITRLSPRRMRDARERAFWKAGFDVINS